MIADQRACPFLLILTSALCLRRSQRALPQAVASPPGKSHPTLFMSCSLWHAGFCFAVPPSVEEPALLLDSVGPSAAHKAE